MASGLGIGLNALLLIPLVLLLDRLLGEPARFHPLVGFGKFATRLESKLNAGSNRFIKGLVAWSLAVIPLCLLVSILDNALGGYWLSLVFGWLAIGWNSLRQHGLAVMNALLKDDLLEARTKTSYLVSRDTSNLNETELSRATIESVLENASDAIFAPLFFLFFFGAPGVVFYRLCNTLDAMWGYRNEQFEQFGKVTARIDDVLNFIPARLTAILFTICGKTTLALDAWLTQGRKWYSPNAGVVMASGAGALNVKLGGSAIYHGQLKARPDLGFGEAPNVSDIRRALTLIDRAIYCLVAFMLVPVIIGGIWLAIAL